MYIYVFCCNTNFLTKLLGTIALLHHLNRIPPSLIRPSILSHGILAIFFLAHSFMDRFWWMLILWRHTFSIKWSHIFDMKKYCDFFTLKPSDLITTLTCVLMTNFNPCLKLTLLPVNQEFVVVLSFYSECLPVGTLVLLAQPFSTQYLLLCSLIIV